MRKFGWVIFLHKAKDNTLFPMQCALKCQINKVSWIDGVALSLLKQKSHNKSLNNNYNSYKTSQQKVLIFYTLLLLLLKVFTMQSSHNKKSRH